MNTKNTNITERIPAIQEYFNSLVRKSKLTKDCYLRDITGFCKVLGINTLEALDNVETKDINKYLAYTKTKRWSNSTTNQRICSIKLLYKYLKDEGLVQNKVVAKLEKLPQDTKETRALSEDECNSVLQAMQRHSTKKRNYVLFSFLLDSGLRKFEYIKLKLADIKEGNRIFVEGKRGKKATVFITDHTMDMLADYIQSERADTMQRYNKSHDYVFVSNTGNQMDRTSFLQSLKNYARLADIEDYESVTVHSARHSGLSIFYNKTKDIKATARKARHSDPSLTARVYVHQTDREYAEAIEQWSFKPATRGI